MNIVDLHVHSTASDGTVAPKDLPLLAKKAGLCAFALTDHDTVSGIDEAMLYANACGIRLIPGIELSTFYKDKEIHIVGLCINHKDPAFLEMLRSEVIRRNERNEKIMAGFADLGLAFDRSEFFEMFAKDTIVTRSHFAAYMKKKGYVKTNSEAFEKYLGDGCPLYFERERRTLCDSVNLIRRTGGAAILAHPLLYHFTTRELDELIAEGKSYGLCGIETMYSSNRGFDELTVRKLARKHNLLESGGSDFHGQNKPDVALGNGRGNVRISYEYFDAIEKSLSSANAPKDN